MSNFILKSAGGTGSQLLGLLTALELKHRTKRSFVLEHNVSSTGVYYPYALAELLLDSEILCLDKVSHGYRVNSNLKPGSHFVQGPLQNNTFSIEKIVSVFRAFGLEGFLRKLVLRELQINQSRVNLQHFSPWFKRVSGGFPSSDSHYAHVDLSRRFEKSRLRNIYNLNQELGNSLVVHYRVGDIRFKFKYPTTTGDGIISPTSFVKKIESLKVKEVYVISDSPGIAKKLLSDSGIEATTMPVSSTIWDEINAMISCRYFIGSWSRVSLFAASVRSYLGRTSFYPRYDSTGVSPEECVSGQSLMDVDYLEESHWVYQDESNYPQTYREYFLN